MASKPQMHLYPLKISLRAQRLIQGSLFYDVFMDTATGLYIRTCPTPEKKVKDFLINNSGWIEETYETSWECFEEYVNEFQNPILQHVIFSMVSHWDWFISNIGKFIDFAEKSISPEKQTDKDLRKLNIKPFAKQIEIVKNETGILLSIDTNTLDLIEEINLVRNLGIHNEWEVDNTYLQKTKTNCFKLGDKRLFEVPELEQWHFAYIQLIGVLASEVATCYTQVPKYEP